MVFSTFAIAAGAVMYWAITTQGNGFRVGTVGVILMVVGAIGLVVSAAVYGTSRRRVGVRQRSYDRQAVDAHGRTTVVHEEIH
jgi:hypothetical protein